MRKKIFVPISVLISVIVFLVFAYFYIQNPENKALSYAENYLPKSGVLMQKAEGFAYVKVDDRYIYELFDILGLKEQGYEIPPYFRRADAPGAHISVFYEKEQVKAKELGQSFAFTPKAFKEVSVGKKLKYMVLQVKSVDLENLRLGYGLSRLLNNHEFHITVGKKEI